MNAYPLDTVGPLFLSDPVNRNHPLNYGRLSWWLSVPIIGGGKYYYDLMGLYPATLINMTTSISGMKGSPGNLGSSIYYDTSSSSYIDVPGTASALSGMSSITVATTVYVNSLKNFNFLISNGAYNESWCIYSQNDSVQTLAWNCHTSGGDNEVHTFASGEFIAGSWQRVACVYNGGGLLIYINGKATSLTTALGFNAGTVSSPSNGMRLGQVNPVNASYYLDGLQDDTSVWNRALSATEIKSDYELSLCGYPGILNRFSGVLISGSGSTAWTQNCNETLTISDGRILNCNKILSQTITLTDSRISGIAKILVEGITLTDNRSLAFGKIIAETISITDSIIKSLGLSKSLSETLTLTDSRSNRLNKIISETITLTDSRVLGLSKILSEALHITDVCTAQLLVQALLKLSLSARYDAMTISTSGDTDTLSSGIG